jgi:hypothetical protein
MPTTQPGLGFNGGILRVGEEATWGTEIARTTQVEVSSVSLAATDEPKSIEVINKRYKTIDEVYQGVKTVGGDFELDVRYDNIDIFLKQLLGAVTITEDSTFIVASTNKYLDFKEDGGSALVATLTEASYPMGEADTESGTLCEEIKTQLEASGTGTYTVTFSNVTKKITIAVAGAVSATQFLWKTGTHGSDNADDHSGTLIGFDDTADGISQASNVADNEVVTVFTKQFRFSDAVLEGLSIEKVIDPNLPTGKTLLYTGAKVNSMDFTLEVDQPLNASCNLICKDEELEETPTTGLTSSTTELALFHHSVLTWDSIDISCKVVSFNITVNNNLSNDRHRLCERTVKQPIPSGKAEISGTITLEFDAATYWSAFNAQTTQDFNLKLTGSEIKSGSNYEFEFDVDYAKISAFPVNPEDQNVITVEMPFMCFASDSSNREIGINVKNTKSTVTV